MSQDELIEKAREDARLFIHELPVDPNVLSKVGRIRETVLIYFGDDNDSLLKVLLDKQTGEFISAEAPSPDTTKGDLD